ncbi:hypothetical protein M758_2G147900 [Ceratodon purpureus]|nr:hypothetical protein M758_2G147900 [Ceratodon purpureus]
MASYTQCQRLPMHRKPTPQRNHTPHFTTLKIHLDPFSKALCRPEIHHPNSHYHHTILPTPQSHKQHRHPEPRLKHPSPATTNPILPLISYSHDIPYHPKDYPIISSILIIHHPNQNPDQ